MADDRKEIIVDNNQNFTIDGNNLYMEIKLPEFGEYTYKYSLVMTKEVFQECYNRWIKQE